MMKRLLCLVAGGILLGTFVAGTGWGGQVVTDSHRDWAKGAVAQEKTLGGAGTPGTLAILYFINNTGSPALDPVQKGLAYMLITDLSKVEGLQLVERAKLQALVEEIGLGKSGLVDPDTVPRVGRLLGAAQVVGGKFYQSDLEQFGIDPAILNTSDAKLSDLPDSKGLLEEIFRMEKDILFEILDDLKIKPATKEAEAELRKPMTTSLEALIFLFKGFNESDQGNYQRAANFYRMSMKADPGLMVAADSLKELEDLGLIGRTNDSRSFLRSLRDRTSLTDQLSPDQAVRRVRTPLEVERRQSLRPPKPDDVDNDKDGFTENQGDCNDTDASIYPGAPEICGDGIDQDCNGSDLKCPEDIDNDGDGYTEKQGDCNDASANIHPGAVEVCGDGIDQDCNGSDLICPEDIDKDGDGYTPRQGDCNDASANIHPGAVEVCGDGIDQDCNGSDLICPEDIDKDGDGYTPRQGDCNDGNASIHPGAAEVCGDGIDQDCNGSDLICPEDIDKDGDGYTPRQGDCNDGNASIHPGAAEVCGDGIDQDCNGSDLICPEDIDKDGDSYTQRQGDCNDANSNIHPGAVEVCGDGIDQDCNGSDLICPEDIDKDGDGYTPRQGDCSDGNASIHPGAAEVCGDGIDQDCNGSDLVCPPDPNDVDNDGDGYTERQGDCNDGNASIHPGAAEVCGDGIDQDCNGSDLVCPPDPNDVDNDGDGYTERQGDCNDGNASIHPGAAEVCGDGIDQDCNGSDLVCPPDPNDVDNDGDGYTERQGDCNDGNASIHPGAAEVCGDGIDQDCNGSDLVCPPDPNDVDNDGDGYTERQGDCNDGNASIHPGAAEVCGDGIDQDCNGSDLVCPPDPNDVDNDGDGYTERQGDCNDGNASIHPGAAEVCGDGIDQDCNGSDLVCPPDPNDVDNDGDGYTERQGDCNDGNASIHPGAVEVCGDGIDQDCNGSDLVCPPDPNDVDNDGDGYTERQGDCNDGNASIHPGAAEVCGDGIDQDCNGSDLVCPPDPNDVDNDGDGYTERQGDCNDGNASIHPGAAEICDDGIDNNCDGLTDCGDTDHCVLFIFGSGSVCVPIQ